MTKTFKVLNCNITFVFRHKWENYQHKYLNEFKDYELGVWFRKAKIVSNKDFNQPKNWSKNVVGNYMFGIRLLVCKMWVSFNINGKSF